MDVLFQVCLLHGPGNRQTLKRYVYIWTCCLMLAIQVGRDERTGTCHRQRYATHNCMYSAGSMAHIVQMGLSTVRLSSWSHRGRLGCNPTNSDHDAGVIRRGVVPLASSLALSYKCLEIPIAKILVPSFRAFLKTNSAFNHLEA